MAFAEGMPARDEGHGLLVVHRHASEGFANIACSSERIRIAIWTFGIDVNQAHLDGCERVLEIPITRVTLVIEPFFFCAPIDVLFGFPDICAASGESEGFESHRLKGDIARENHQVGP